MWPFNRKKRMLTEYNKDEIRRRIRVSSGSYQSVKQRLADDYRDYDDTDDFLTTAMLMYVASQPSYRSPQYEDYGSGSRIWENGGPSYEAPTYNPPSDSPMPSYEPAYSSPSYDSSPSSNYDSGGSSSSFDSGGSSSSYGC